MTKQSDAQRGVQLKIKRSRENVSSSTTFQDDNEFKFWLGANESAAFEIKDLISAPSSGGFKQQFTVPSGASGRYSTNQTGAGNADILITSSNAYTGALNVTVPTRTFGYVDNGSTAGYVTRQWAQAASNGTATYVERGSLMEVIRE